MDGGPEFIECLPLGFLAFQAGGQVATGRLLGLNEIPTAVLTSVYCDLSMDKNLLKPFKENIPRNRRFGSVLCLLTGAIAGGWIQRSNGGMVSSLSRSETVINANNRNRQRLYGLLLG
jgi:Protein of unknown function (DUF1275)